MSSDGDGARWEVGGQPVHDWAGWCEAVLDVALQEGMVYSITRNGVIIAHLQARNPG